MIAVPEFFAGLEAKAGRLRRVLPNWSAQDVPVALFWSSVSTRPNLRGLGR